MAKDKYRVLAGTVAGHKPGEEFSFEDEDGPVNVQALLDAGAIEPVKGTAPKKEEEE